MSTITLTVEELEDMLDRAAKRGAKAALAELGLHDDTASKDLNDVRDLLSAWRATRKTMWHTAVKLVTASALAFIAAAVFMSLKNGQ